MGHQYSGVNAFPVDYTIPDDGDPPTASAIDVALEALGDRTQYLLAHIRNLQSQDFLANGSVTVPPGVTTMLALGWGAGGAGGAGTDGNSIGDPPAGDLPFTASPGGGGGAGAEVRLLSFPVTPGDTISVTIGTCPGTGQAGFPSTVNNGSGLIVAVLAGGAAGSEGIPIDPTDPLLASVGNVTKSWAAGGSGITTVVNCGMVTPGNLLAPPPGGPGSGGHGSTGPGLVGCSAASGAMIGIGGAALHAGGAGGLAGTSVRIANPPFTGVVTGAEASGGGGGGGGGGGPAGHGADGGFGGSASGASGGTGTNGNAGLTAAANSGAGGGGGGGGGAARNPGHGGLGGLGGSGFVRLLWVSP